MVKRLINEKSILGGEGNKQGCRGIEGLVRTGAVATWPKNRGREACGRAQGGPPGRTVHLEGQATVGMRWSEAREGEQHLSQLPPFSPLPPTG